MSGNRAVLDSNAIIYASKGLVDSDELLLENELYFASIITFIEVYSHEFQSVDEKRIIDEILGSIEIVDLDRSIADQAVIYRKNKNKKIKLPDAAILATAKVLDAALLTDNLTDFQGVDDLVSIVGINYRKFESFGDYAHIYNG